MFDHYAINFNEPNYGLCNYLAAFDGHEGEAAPVQPGSAYVLGPFLPHWRGWI